MIRFREPMQRGYRYIALPSGEILKKELPRKEKKEPLY